MHANDEVERAKQKLEDKMKEHLAKRILKISEEGFFPSRLKTCILILKVVCAIAVFICGPIMGWLYTELTRGTVSFGLFVVYVLPMSFLGIITALVLTMKTPTE